MNRKFYILVIIILVLWLIFSYAFIVRGEVVKYINKTCYEFEGVYTCKQRVQRKQKEYIYVNSIKEEKKEDIIVTSFWEREYSDQEIEIAKVISAEACGEGYMGMHAVANVIANRSRKYNLTPYEVVTAENQFYGYTSPNKEILFNQCKKDSLFLAHNILKLQDITDGALYFKQLKEPKKSWHKENTITIKNHEFYK